MRAKPRKFFSCRNATDRLILFNNISDMDEPIDLELDIYDNKQRFDSRTDTTYADYFINEATELLGRDEHSRIEDLRQEIKNYDGWRVFMKTLSLATLTYKAGDIPDIAQAGAAHIPVQRGAAKGGTKKKEIDAARHCQWKLDAVAISEKHPSYKPWRIAGELEDVYKDNPTLFNKRDTIYRVIK